MTLNTHPTSLHSSRFEVEIHASSLTKGAFDVQNIITISHAKLLQKLGTLTQDNMAELESVR